MFRLKQILRAIRLKRQLERLPPGKYVAILKDGTNIRHDEDGTVVMEIYLGRNIKS